MTVSRPEKGKIYHVKRHNEGLLSLLSFFCESLVNSQFAACKCGAEIRPGFQIPERVYLDVVGQGVDKFEPGDPLVAAHNADVLGVFAVRHADPVGRTQSQGPLFATAVEIVKPDGS